MFNPKQIEALNVLEQVLKNKETYLEVIETINQMVEEDKNNERERIAVVCDDCYEFMVFAKNEHQRPSEYYSYEHKGKIYQQVDCKNDTMGWVFSDMIILNGTSEDIVSDVKKHIKINKGYYDIQKT